MNWTFRELWPMLPVHKDGEPNSVKIAWFAICLALALGNGINQALLGTASRNLTGRTPTSMPTRERGDRCEGGQAWGGAGIHTSKMFSAKSLALILNTTEPSCLARATLPYPRRGASPPRYSI